jgi:hypothetical protein
MADQRNEVAAFSVVCNILAENPVPTNKFPIAQASLLNFVQKGIAIRQNNQKIGPANNPAIAGLATVANAQRTELQLTISLGQGGVDVSREHKTVEELKDFSVGIVQNMKNLAAACHFSFFSVYNGFIGKGNKVGCGKEMEGANG